MIAGKLERTERGGFRVEIDGEELDPAPSLAIVNHSPDGFAWGYPGSGPSQLALAILLHFGGKQYAKAHYADFKTDIIARLDVDKEFDMEDAVVEEWIKAHQ